MNEAELKSRTKEFALRIIKLCGSLPNSLASRTIANQLVRSGTSVGANYRAACRARSKPDFISKLGIVEEEADECAFWIERIMDSNMLPSTRVVAILTEANELTKIMTASRISAAGRRLPIKN